MASRRASRTVVVTISVPSGNSSITGAVALLVIVAGAAGALGVSSALLAVGAGACTWPSACMSGAGAFCSDAWAFGVPPAEAADTSSPSAVMTAIGVLTFTPSVPSSMRILARKPSSIASTSIVALSVSISARTSPDLTGSPSFFSHLASLPSSIVGERAGIRISVAMEHSSIEDEAVSPYEGGSAAARVSGGRRLRRGLPAGCRSTVRPDPARDRAWRTRRIR